MNLTEEKRCLLWLSMAEVSASRVHKLIDHFGSAKGIWDAFGHTDKVLFQKGTKEILSRYHSASAMDDLVDIIDKKHIHLLFADDEFYSDLLKSIDDPPYLLYYAGRLSCLSMPTIGIVGTRMPSQYGEQMAYGIAQELGKAGVCIASGLAHGIDAFAHRGALASGGSTIGVLGCGINRPYPSDHRGLLRQIAGGNGLIISEYPIDSKPIAYHFPHRNRIISGLSQAVVFVEGKIKSGGMRTVQCALIQGREVFAIPGRVGLEASEGTHAILREGARIATSGQDILEDLGYGIHVIAQKKQETNTQHLPPEQQIIAKALKNEPLFLEDLAKRVGQPVDDIFLAVSIMEMNGVIYRESDNRFALFLSHT